MSLHIGNLSSRTQRAELEHFFQKFGRCDVWLKDGYGLVVYESPLNAEKALRTLQGRSICGQPLTLTWSNKQPRSFTKFKKAVRSYEPLYSSFPTGGRDYINRKLHSSALQNDSHGIKRQARNGRDFNYADMLDESRNYRQDSIRDYSQEDHYREDRLDEAGIVEPNVVDNGRWNEQLYDQPNASRVDNGVEIDRYECDHGYDQNGEDENRHLTYSGVSPALRSSQEMMEREHHLSEAPLDPPDDSKLLQTCYNCGDLGHKRRSCPRRKASIRKFKTFDRRHDDGNNRRGRVESKMNRYGTSSHGELRYKKDFISISRLGNGRKISGSGRHRRLMRNQSSLEAKETDEVWRKDHGGKRRRRRAYGTLKSHSGKKARGTVSYRLHSDCTQSRSHSTSQFSKPVSRSGSRSRSRSVSLKVQFSSADSRSSSASHSCRYTHSKSKSSLSSHKSLSVSGSLDQPLPPSPKKVQLHQKGPLDNASKSKCEEILVEQGQLVGDVSLESAELENNMLAMRNETVLSSYKVEVEMNKHQPMQRYDEDNHMLSMSLCEITNPSIPLSDKVLFTAGSLSSETFKETKEFPNSASLMVQMPLTIKSPHSEAPGSSHSGRSINISSKEMHMVLKHYGLELPDENEKHLPVEDCFGSARLWPWEIIYYQRWKKGSISTENYSRRVSQNQEFGIVDKYI